MIWKIYYPRFTEAYYISLFCLPAAPGTDSESSTSNAVKKCLFYYIPNVIIMFFSKDVSEFLPSYSQFLLRLRSHLAFRMWLWLTEEMQNLNVHQILFWKTVGWAEECTLA